MTQEPFDFTPKRSPQFKPDSQCGRLLNAFMSNPDHTLWNWQIRDIPGGKRILNHTGRISDLRKYHKIEIVDEIEGSVLYKLIS